MGSMSQMMNQGIEVRIYGDDQQKLLKTSNQIMKLITSVKGTENVDNGITAQDKQLHLKINKNKAADDSSSDLSAAGRKNHNRKNFNYNDPGGKRL